MAAKILHLDIETAPNKVYAWGLWGQDIGINQIIEAGYTMCWAAKWHGKAGIMFSSIFEDGEEVMLRKMYDLLESADIVCHYNGTKFDMPTLNKEFVLHGWEPPSSYKEIDLLRTARSRFKFPSNKLDYIAQALGLGGKIKHMGMDLWTACMDDDPKAWSLMKRYNKQDVALLEKLYLELRPWIKSHPNMALYKSTENPSCPSCGSEDVKKNGVEHTRAGTYQRYKCNSCRSPSRGRTNLNVEKGKVLM